MNLYLCFVCLTLILSDWTWEFTWFIGSCVKDLPLLFVFTEVLNSKYVSLRPDAGETDSGREVVEMDGETGGEIFDYLQATVMKV